MAIDLVAPKRPRVWVSLAPSSGHERAEHFRPQGAGTSERGPIAEAAPGLPSPSADGKGAPPVHPPPDRGCLSSLFPAQGKLLRCAGKSRILGGKTPHFPQGTSPRGQPRSSRKTPGGWLPPRPTLVGRHSCRSRLCWPCPLERGHIHLAPGVASPAQMFGRHRTGVLDGTRTFDRRRGIDGADRGADR